MALTMQEFEQHVAAAGIMPVEELRDIQASLPAGPSDNGADSSASVEALAQELVRRRKLTDYQAQILSGSEPTLTIGSYIILDEIGAGGMGCVFKARHRRMKRVVALKVLPIPATESHESIQRFQREVEAAARLNHPNIVLAHDASEEDSVHYLVMEYVDGPSLAKLATQGKGLSVAAVVNYIAQAARGLEYAHQQGVVHRDIKPSNLLLDSQGVVKILDMGLARMRNAPGALEESGDETLTRAGQIVGTIDFMSPEQAEDSRQADARSDIYSLGCTMYYLLTGEPPYPGDTLTKKLLGHRNEAIPLLLQKRRDVRADLDSIFRRMVAKKPEHRYQSMSEVVRALETWMVAHGEASPGSGILQQGTTGGSGAFAVVREPPPPSTSGDGGDFILQEDADRLKSREASPAPTQTLVTVQCSCGRRLLAPTRFQGKRVKCPQCGAAMLIPTTESASTKTPSPLAESGAIDVLCQCGQRFAAKAKLAGKTVKCTKCGTPLRIPEASKPTAVRSTDVVEATCKCGKRIKVTADLIGKSVKCPQCSAVVTIPKPNAP